MAAYVGLGSNLDDPHRQVSVAIEELDGIPNTRRTASSSLYRSPPMGPTDQPDYINAVTKLDTALEPNELLEELQKIERLHGRVRGPQRWGPRTLDLDILLYADAQIDTPGLTIPHPGLHERAFVLYPLSEIAASIEIPGRGKLSALKARCPRGQVEKINNEKP
ncbi:MAG: 2-amino-4-hydroxy-6-hydroxymethyldihydropteridine diphosphokinase [Gammaproteobacteria bacterium]